MAEEKQFGKASQEDYTSWQKKYSNLEAKYKTKEAEVVDLKEQVRDLMFFMEAQNTISKSDMKDEIAEGSVTVEAGPSKGKNSRRKKKVST